MRKIPLLAALLVILVPGCLSMQSQSTLDEMQGSTPFVEAFVEYPGPQAKWAGPVIFILHVVAKDAGTAQVAIAPALFGRVTPPLVARRKLASTQPAPKGLSGNYAREQIAQLATALQGADQSFAGCLYPIRVRLVRADGALLEKQGCRSQSGWSTTASEFVNRFILASLPPDMKKKFEQPPPKDPLAQPEKTRPDPDEEPSQ